MSDTNPNDKAPSGKRVTTNNNSPAFKIEEWGELSDGTQLQYDSAGKVCAVRKRFAPGTQYCYLRNNPEWPEPVVAARAALAMIVRLDGSLPQFEVALSSDAENIVPVDGDLCGFLSVNGDAFFTSSGRRFRDLDEWRTFARRKVKMGATPL